VPIPLRLRIYNACVKPILLYNTGTIALPETRLEKFNAFHRKQLRQVIGVHYPFIISNQKLQEKISRSTRRPFRPLTLEIAERRWKLFGNILRLPLLSAPPQIMMYCYYTNIKIAGRQGRRPTSLPHLLHNDLQHSGFNLRTEVDLENLRRTALDQRKWNRFSKEVQRNISIYQAMLDVATEDLRKNRAAVVNCKRKSHRRNEKRSRKKAKPEEPEATITQVCPSRKRTRSNSQDSEVPENAEGGSRCEERSAHALLRYNLRAKTSHNSYRGRTR